MVLLSRACASSVGFGAHRGRAVAAWLPRHRMSSSTPAADEAYAVPKLPTSTLPVTGSSQRYPVRRVYCVGSNYRAHTVEMGGNPDKQPPFFFMKPPDAVIDTSGPDAVVPYPPETADFHHEVELVVAIGEGGRQIAPEQAMRHVFAFGVGVDLTRRDMQHVAKKTGRPWDCSKGFDSSAPMSALTPIASSESVVGEGNESRAIWLKVDGVVRQQSVLGDLVWSVPEMIAKLSQLFTLQPGDLLFTGTPAGVGPLRVGETVEAGVAGLQLCRFRVAPALS